MLCLLLKCITGTKAYAKRDLHDEEIYTKKIITREGDIYKEDTYTEKDIYRERIYKVGELTWRGNIDRERIYNEEGGEHKRKGTIFGRVI